MFTRHLDHGSRALLNSNAECVSSCSSGPGVFTYRTDCESQPALLSLIPTFNPHMLSSTLASSLLWQVFQQVLPSIHQVTAARDIPQDVATLSQISWPSELGQNKTLFFTNYLLYGILRTEIGLICH